VQRLALVGLGLLRLVRLLLFGADDFVARLRRRTGRASRARAWALAGNTRCASLPARRLPARELPTRSTALGRLHGLLHQ
jgi:hypothetical protein